MPVSDLEYTKWLSRDGQQRAILAEIKYYFASTESTEYISNYAFISASTDTPPDTSYNDIIAGIPEFEVSLSVPDPTSGDMKIKTDSSFGRLEVINENGAIDDWLNRAWDGREITLYLGDPSWEKADFRVFMTGIVEDIEPRNRDSLTFIIRDRDYLLDVPVETSLITTGEEVDNVKPLSIGNAFNVSPILLDHTTHTYIVSSGQINDIPDVRDNGVTVAYTKDLANGQFSLTAGGAEKITCDVQGDSSTGYLTTVSDIVKFLILKSTTLTLSDLDTTSFDDLNVACPQEIGVHYTSKTVYTIDAISDILSTVGAFFVFDRDGKLAVKQFLDPDGQTPVVEIGYDDIVINSFNAISRSKPVSSITVGYKRNYTIQEDGLAGSLDEQQRQVYGIEYKSANSIDSGVLIEHPLALTTELIPSYMVSQIDAQSEADRILELFSDNSMVYQLEAFLRPSQIRVGDVIKVTHDRYGFSSGKNGLITKMSFSPDKSKTEIEFWVKSP